jgi:hypothetical protein
VKQPKIVLVRWIDQNRFHGWQHADALKKDVAGMKGKECVSVGFLVHHDKTSISLSESLCWTEQVGCTLWIPRKALIGMQTLREASKGKL